jgi:hypothetical protein
VDDKSLFLLHGWYKGVPSEVVYAAAELKDFKAGKHSSLPVVTPKNFNMYVFDISSEGPGSEGPLSGLTFVPDG